MAWFGGQFGTTPVALHQVDAMTMEGSVGAAPVSTWTPEQIASGIIEYLKIYPKGLKSTFLAPKARDEHVALSMKLQQRLEQYTDLENMRAAWAIVYQWAMENGLVKPANYLCSRHLQISGHARVQYDLGIRCNADQILRGFATKECAPAKWGGAVVGTEESLEEIHARISPPRRTDQDIMYGAAEDAEASSMRVPLILGAIALVGGAGYLIFRNR